MDPEAKMERYEVFEAYAIYIAVLGRCSSSMARATPPKPWAAISAFALAVRAILPCILVILTVTTVQGQDSGALKDPWGRDRLTALIEVLAKGNREERVDAAGRIEFFGPDGAAAVPALILMLREDDGDLQCSAARSLARVGGQSRAAVQAVVEAVKEERVECVGIIVDALESLLGDGAPGSEDGYLSLMRHASFKVRMSTLTSLTSGRRIPKVILQQLVETLQSKMPYERMLACRALDRVEGGVRFAWNALAGLLNDEKLPVAECAAWSLSSLREPDAALLAALTEVYSSSSIQLRAAVGYTLWRMGHRPGPPVADLLQALEGTMWRGRLFDALSEVGDEARPALDLAYEVFRQGVGSLPYAALRFIAFIAPDGEAKESCFREAISDSNYCMRREAALLLGRRGLHSRNALDLLEDLVGDADSSVSLQAIRSLGEYVDHGRRAARILLRTLGDQRLEPLNIAVLIALATESSPAFGAILCQDGGDGDRDLLEKLLAEIREREKLWPKALPLLERMIASEALGTAMSAKAGALVGVIRRSLDR